MDLDYTVIITAIFAGFALLEWTLGRFGDPATREPRDTRIELISTLTILLLTAQIMLMGFILLRSAR